MSERNKNLLNLLVTVLLIAAGIARWKSLPAVNVDLYGYVDWYNYIAEHGLTAMGDNFAVYTPPYLYLLWLATLARTVIPSTLAIKLIPMLFDLLSAFAVYKIVRLKYPQGNVALLAATIFISLPTVIMNSTLWGEIDALYTSFLLLAIYFLLTNRALPAMLFFGVAVSIKAQAVFVVPFLIVLALKRRIPWYFFFIPPAVYLAIVLPAILAGRPLLQALTIYLSQAGEFTAPSMHAPNLYILTLIPPYYIDWKLAIYSGFLIGVASIIIWITVYSRRQYELNHGMLILSALASLALVPYVLPKMHDRYFYPADILSLVFAFYYPTYWFLPLLFQAASGTVYYLFLFSVDPSDFPPRFIMAALFSTLAVIIVLVKQNRETRKSARFEWKTARE